MSSRLFIPFSALLLAVCLLSACGIHAPYNAEEIAFDPVQSVQTPAPADRKLPFGDESRTLVYQYDETTLSGETWEVFQAPDGTLARFCKQNGSVAVNGWLTSTIADAPGKPRTEEEFLACIKEWVRLLAPEADLSAYRYSCITTYLVIGEDALGTYGESRTANRFYRAQNEDEQVEGYLFTYTQMKGGYATENGVTVETDSKGNLRAIRYDNYETDWAFSITDEDLEDTVSAFIKTHEKEASHSASDVEILEKHLAVVQGEVRLAVNVTAFCAPRKSDEAYIESFTLYLSPKEQK
ncbi:MAG: hypothetical protein J1E00_07585 [Oscillospiraceae bacterium]|nr:hypothetical protein [Oscillospiraceae bacterium]